jgi:hypothetical protein
MSEAYTTMDLNPEWKYDPYPYQEFPFAEWHEGKKRFILVWPRRAGKDLTAINFMVARALERVGTYFYFLPTHKQAKRIIWDGMTDDGTRFRDYIPNEIISGDPNESELQIALVNGSIIQLVGIDTFDTSALGTNCVGAVLSEYSVQKPSGWDYIRPILAKNGGWAMFIYTPRGHNHGYELYDRNKDNPDWAVSKLTADDIVDQNGIRLIPASMIEAERRSGMPEEKIQQEFYTSFAGIQQGSFFADQCIDCENEDRIGSYPYDPDFPVHTVSDLGVGLKFVTWFFQVKQGRAFWIDYEPLESGGIPEFIKLLRDKKYRYGKHFAPFDIKSTETGTGQTRVETARRLGLYFIALPKLPVADRIDAGRRIFPVSYFNKGPVSHRLPEKSGWSSLLNYRREYNEDTKEYSDKEFHDWSSHGGSAFTYGAIAIRRFLGSMKGADQAQLDFDELEDPKATAETEFDEMEE